MMKSKRKRQEQKFQMFLQDNIMLFVFLVFFICGMLFVDKFASAYNIKNYLKNCSFPPLH